jgi:hypothetical protein
VTFGADDRPRRRNDVHAVRDDDVVVLVAESGAEVCRLNDTAYALWQLCDGVTTAAEMSIAIHEAAGVPADAAEHEVTAALEQLHRGGALA